MKILIGRMSNLCNVTVRVKGHQKAVPKKTKLCRNMIAKLILQLSGIIPELLPPMGGIVQLFGSMAHKRRPRRTAMAVPFYTSLIRIKAD